MLVKNVPVFIKINLIITTWMPQARIKAYFGELLPRIVFQHASVGLASMERSLRGDGTVASPRQIGPNISLGQLTPVRSLPPIY